MDEGAGELFLAEKSSPAPSRSPTPSKNFTPVRTPVPVAVSRARPSFPHHPAGTRDALHCQSPGQPGEHQAGSPYQLVVPHSGKFFEPFLPPLSPERPRPAGTSTPSLLSCRHSPESFPSPALAGCHDRARHPLRQLSKTPCIPGGAPIRSLFRHVPMSPTFRQRRGLSSTPE